MVKTQQDKESEDIPRLVVPALRRWSYMGLNALLHGHLHESAVYDLNQHYDLGQLQPILDITHEIYDELLPPYLKTPYLSIW